MFEINVTVSCPDLVKAATLLASAMGCSKIGEPTNANPTAAPVAMSVNGTAPAAQFGSAAPAVAPTPTPPVGQTIPANAAPVASVPLAQAPVFTLEQVSKAGADLITVQPAKMPELMGLLAQFGVQTVNALKPDQLGAFATALRGMGAQI